jgi:chaperonin cofactor prefoldin
MLKQDAEALKTQLEDIQNRIETLEKTENTAKSDK